MATVWLAHDLRHDRPVALKALHPELAATLGPDRFQREIRLAARLQHSHILGVHDSGDTAGQLWFTMPYVEGESLRDRLRREKQVPLEDALRVALEAARALDYAHRQGVIHRDIKPENILLTREGDTLLADFGIARALAATHDRLTETGLVVGTPAYMSPEQAAGDRELDPRTDIYSLGAVLYEMLAGEPPFTGPTAQVVNAKRLTGAVPRVRMVRPSVPETVDAAIYRAMAAAPADRFATAAAFGQALAAHALAPGDATVAAPRSEPTPARRGLVIAIGVVLLAALAAALLLMKDDRGAASSAAGPPRLAVLPFENHGAAADEYFAESMSDEVRGKLAALPALKVIARTSSSEYKATRKRPEEIGRELGVQYLLTGTVRWDKTPSGDRVRVSPELIDVGDASTRWQRSFDAPMTDVFAVQGQIAGEVAQALELVLGEGNRQSLETRATVSLAAYDAYMRGEEESASLTRDEPVPLGRALRHYERAVALDSAFAQAWLQITRAHGRLYWRGNDPTPARIEAVRQAAERVGRLRPGSYEAHWALAEYHGARSDHRRGAAEAREALRLAPAHPDLLSLLARFEQHSGEWDAATDHLRQAALLDPRSPAVAFALAGHLVYRRRFAEAREVADRARARNPTNLDLQWIAAAARLGEGRRDEAYRVAREVPPGMDSIEHAVNYAGSSLSWMLNDTQRELALRVGPAPFNHDTSTWGGAVGSIYLLRGDSARARAYFRTALTVQERLVADNPGHLDQQQHLGRFLALLGRKQEAIRWGEQAMALARAHGDVHVMEYIRAGLAAIYVHTGEHTAALAHVDTLLRSPSRFNPGRLREDDDYTALRDDPRFKRLLAAHEVMIPESPSD